MTTKITGAAIAELCTSVHADNVAAGWWSDLKTGERIDRGELLELDVMGAIAEKRAFNKTRQDHSREARLADGGKKC